MGAIVEMIPDTEDVTTEVKYMQSPSESPTEEGPGVEEGAVVEMIPDTKKSPGVEGSIEKPMESSLIVELGSKSLI